MRAPAPAAAVVAAVAAAALVPVVALTGSACFDARVPPEAIISCADTRDCPPSTRCSAPLSRCVPETLVDEPPPAADSASLVPALGNRATTFTLTLDFPAPLGVDPLAHATLLDDDGAPVGEPQPFTLAAGTDRAADRFVLAWRPTTRDVDGRYAVVVDVVSVGGVLAQQSFELELDSTAPVVTDVVVAPPAFVPLGADVAVTFTVSDAHLGAPPAVTLVGGFDATLALVGTDVAVDPVSGAETWAFAATVPATFTAGDATLHVADDDAAGNRFEAPVAALALGDAPNGDVPSSCVAVVDGAAVCTDSDGDGQVGFSAACADAYQDCDDQDPLTFFGAPEIAGSGKHERCDGAPGGEDVAVDEDNGVFIDPPSGFGAACSRADPCGMNAGDDNQGGRVAFLSAGGPFSQDCDPFTGSIQGAMDGNWQESADAGDVTIISPAGCPLLLQSEAVVYVRRLSVRGSMRIEAPLVVVDRVLVEGQLDIVGRAVVVDSVINALSLPIGARGTRVLNSAIELVTAFDRDVLLRRGQIGQIDLFDGADVVALDSVFLGIADDGVAVDCFDCRGVVVAHSSFLDRVGVRYSDVLRIVAVDADVALVNNAFDLAANASDGAPAVVFGLADPATYTGLFTFAGNRLIVDDVDGAVAINGAGGDVPLGDFDALAAHPNARSGGVTNNAFLEGASVPTVPGDRFALQPSSELADVGVDPFAYGIGDEAAVDQNGGCRGTQDVDIGPDELDDAPPPAP